jgi:hypothetical protein
MMENKKSLAEIDSLSGGTDILRLKQAYGAIYGLVMGLSFAIATWGLDAYILSQSHMYLPWLKLIVGGILCSLIGCFAGWISARTERWYFILTAWLGVSLFFAWLITVLPLQINPYVSALFRPQWRGLINYETFDQLTPRFWVAFAWVIIFLLITGAIQIPLVETSVFSVSTFGKIAPFLFGMFIIGIGGVFNNDLNNEPLRAAIVAMDRTVQFTIDNKGLKVDPALSRQNHAGALRSIQDQVTPERSMTVGGYDALLGEIQVVIQFEHLLVNCFVIYGQPAFCKPALQN